MSIFILHDSSTVSMFAAAHTSTDLATRKQTHNSSDRPAVKQAHLLFQCWLVEKTKQKNNWPEFQILPIFHYNGPSRTFISFKTNKQHCGVSQKRRAHTALPPKDNIRVLGFKKQKEKRKKKKTVLALKKSKSPLIDASKYTSGCHLLLFSRVWHQTLIASTLTQNK